jgi:uncharacterized repeat protein (TIGR02543 family)
MDYLLIIHDSSQNFVPSPLTFAKVLKSKHMQNSKFQINAGGNAYRQHSDAPMRRTSCSKKGLFRKLLTFIVALGFAVATMNATGVYEIYVFGDATMKLEEIKNGESLAKGKNGVLQFGNTSLSAYELFGITSESSLRGNVVMEVDNNSDYTYPCVLFRKREDAMKFISGGLKWDQLPEDFEDIFQNWTFVSNKKGRLKYTNAGLNYLEGSSAYIVMQKVKRINNEIKVEALLESPIEADAENPEYLTGAYNRFITVYTNTAPYPVTIKVLLPALLESESTWKGIKLKNGAYDELYQHTKILMPHKQYVHDLFTFKLQDSNGNTPRMADKNTLLCFISPTGNLNFIPGMENGGTNFSHRWKVEVGGLQNYIFAVKDVYPTSFNISDNKDVTLALLRPDRLGAITLTKPDGSSLTVPSGKISAGLPGIRYLSINEYLAETGSYQLRIANTSNGRIEEYTLKVDATASSTLPSTGVKRIFVVQDKSNGRLKDIPGDEIIPNQYNLLFDILGNTVDGGNGSTIFLPGTTINGLLKVKNGDVRWTNPVSGAPASLVPVDDPDHQPMVYYTGGSFRDIPVTTPGDFSINLNRNTLYSTTAPTQDYFGEYDEHKGVLLDFNGTKKLQFGVAPIAETPGIYLYTPPKTAAGYYAESPYLSVTGQASVGALLNVFMRGFNNYIEADVNVHDLRFNGQGFDGIRADANGFVGFHDPFGLITAGVDAALELDVLPETRNPWFRVEGGISIGPVGGLYGKFAMKQIEARVGSTDLGRPWLPEDLEVILEAPIPIAPPTPITLNKIGGHITGMASTLQMASDWTGADFSKVVPPFNFGLTAGIGIAKELVNIGGKANIGLTTLGGTDGYLNIMIVPVFQDGHYTMGFKDTGESIQLGNVTLPVVDIGIDMGGTLNLFQVFIGDLKGKMSFTPSKLARKMNIDMSRVNAMNSWDDYRKLVSEYSIPTMNVYPLMWIAITKSPFETYKPTLIQEFQGYKNFGLDALTKFQNNQDKTWEEYAKVAVDGAASLYAVLTDIVTYELSGKIRIDIPKGLPLGGQTLANVEAGLSLEKIYGKAGVDIKAEVCFGSGKCYGPNEHIEATITYYWNNLFHKNFTPDVSAQRRAARIAQAGDPVYGKGFELRLPALRSAPAGGKVDLPPTLYMPNFVAMLKDAETGKNSLRAFSNQFENTQTQTMQNLSRSFLVLVRSKEADAGLKITGPNAGITANRTAADIQWVQAEGDDFYTGTVYVKVPTEQEMIAWGATAQEAAAAGALDLNGEWKVEAYDSHVTAFNPAGRIDCDFFYTYKNASISNLDYAAGIATWENLDLGETATYRMRFSLVDAADATKIVPLHTTGEFTAADPFTEYDLPASVFDAGSGNYQLKAALEKLDGYLVLNDLPEGVSASKTWTEQNAQLSNAFPYVHPNQPAPATHATAVAENGTAIIRWTAPADPNKLSGYIINIINENGAITGSVKADANETQIIMEAGNSDWDDEGHEIPKSLEYYKPYTFEVIAFHSDSINGRAMLTEGNAATTGEVTVFYPSRPILTLAYRHTTGNLLEDSKNIISNTPVTPMEIEGLKIALQSKHSLSLYSQGPKITGAELRISEEMNAFYENNIGNEGVKPAFTDRSNSINVSDGYARIPFTGFAEGHYIMDVKLADGGDYNLYRFNLFIDNTAPDLLVGLPMQNEAGDRTISGATEPDATLLFNGADLTAQMSNGNFTIPVEEDLSHIHFLATDEAGNNTTATAILAGLASLPADDNTTAIRIITGKTQMLTGEMLTAAAEVKRNNVFVTPEDGAVKWTVIEGNACASVDNNTGEITAKEAGTAFVQAAYKGVLKEVVLITVADAYTINDLYVSEITGETSVKISFTEPQNAGGKRMEYSVTEPVDGEVTEGWRSVSATFDGNGNATVSGVPASKTVYFRMIVTGGINEGISNIAGRAPQVFNTVSVTFDPQNGDEPAVYNIVNGSLLAAPEDPEREGYNFEGWCPETTDCTVFWNFDEDVVTEDVIFYAQWTKTVSINEVKTANLILYPNPADERVSIAGLRGGERISITDVSGRSVLVRWAANTTETLFVGRLRKGVYFVHVVGDGGSGVLKLIVD